MNHHMTDEALSAHKSDETGIQRLQAWQRQLKSFKTIYIAAALQRGTVKIKVAGKLNWDRRSEDRRPRKRNIGRQGRQGRQGTNISQTVVEIPVGSLNLYMDLEQFNAPQSKGFLKEQTPERLRRKGENVVVGVGFTSLYLIAPVFPSAKWALAMPIQ